MNQSKCFKNCRSIIFLVLDRARFLCALSIQAKSPEMVWKFLGKLPKQSKTVGFWRVNYWTIQSNSRNSASKIKDNRNLREEIFENLDIPQEVVLILKFRETFPFQYSQPENPVPLVPGNFFRKFKPEILVEWKALQFFFQLNSHVINYLLKG